MANASDSGNGGSGVDGVYQVNVGLDTAVGGNGWGWRFWWCECRSIYIWLG